MELAREVAWLHQVDERVWFAPARFTVEFMLRESKKYAATLGWGWSRWRGVDLQPYGKDANFARMRRLPQTPAQHGLLFTMPIATNQGGSNEGSCPLYLAITIALAGCTNDEPGL